jgi:ribosome modulation factor
MANDWQFTNQFFEEGEVAYLNGISVRECPYNYLSVEQDDEKLVQQEYYRQKEWLGGYHHAYRQALDEKKAV